MNIFDKLLKREEKPKISQVTKGLQKQQLWMQLHFGKSNEQQLRTIAEDLVTVLKQRYGELIADLQVKIGPANSSVVILLVTHPTTREQCSEIEKIIKGCADELR